MSVVSFAQGKPDKSTPPPPPPPPEIVKDIKIESVQEVKPPPPPPSIPRAPKKPHVIQMNLDTQVDNSIAPGKEVIMQNEAEVDTAQLPHSSKKPKHVVHHKVKAVVVQPKDPGKATSQKNPQHVSN
ncbi:MAG TPA: hypothetical protein VFQ58_08055 [Flavisolibacter sp.]|nr:hypothetical protein [Flavisolibacter sp.]